MDEGRGDVWGDVWGRWEGLLEDFAPGVWETRRWAKVALAERGRKRPDWVVEWGASGGWGRELDMFTAELLAEVGSR